MSAMGRNSGNHLTETHVICKYIYILTYVHTYLSMRLCIYIYIRVFKYACIFVHQYLEKIAGRVLGAGHAGLRRAVVAAPGVWRRDRESPTGHSCMHTCMHACIYAYMYTCIPEIHAYMHANKKACIACIDIYIDTYTHMYIHIHIYIYTYVCP